MTEQGDNPNTEGHDCANKSVRTRTWKKAKYVENWNTLTHGEQKLIKEYDKVIEQTVHFPDKVGYMLDKISLDGTNAPQVSAKVGYYYSNVLQSHILEYELYRQYKKRKKIDISRPDVENPLFYLPFRKKIHDKCGNGIHDSLLSGAGRASLMSVQIMVLIANKSESYDCLRIRRSENVSVKAGFTQFIPSGGFEAFNDGDDIDTQRSNYSINKILFRELAEECFGMPETTEFCRRPVEDIYNQPGITDVLKMLQENFGDDQVRKKAQYQFIGITQGLVSLRPEFCFLLVLHEPDIVSKIVCNSETNKMISLIDIRELETAGFWPADELVNLNSTSAALWELARESELYKECLNPKKSK